MSSLWKGKAMADRRFRFGVIAGPSHTGPQWRALARRTEELGYSTLLMPDEFQGAW
jgi:hypothetical protein